MPIVFVCSGVFNLILLFDKIYIKSKYKKTIYIIFLFLIQVSYFSFYVKTNDIYFNFLQSILFIILFLFSLTKSKLNLKILLLSFVSAIGYDFLINTFDNLMLYSYSNVCFLIVLIFPIFISNFYKAQTLLFLNLCFQIVSNVNFEISKYTFAFIDFDFCFQIVFMFLILKLIKYFLGLYFLSFSKYGCMRSNGYEKIRIVFSNNFFYMFDFN